MGGGLRAPSRLAAIAAVLAAPAHRPASTQARGRESAPDTAQPFGQVTLDVKVTADKRPREP